MPVPPPGHNLQYFSPLNPSENLVTRVTASASEYSSKIAFNVPAHHKAAVKQCLNEIGVLINEWDTESYGTWFDVIGVVNIKKSLDSLCAKHLIDTSFYQTLIERFPKAHGGVLNLSSITVTPTPPHHDLSSLFDIATIEFSQLFESVQLQRLLSTSVVPVVKQKAINETQKNIIDATLAYIFEDIQNIQPASIAIKALKLISKKAELTEKEKNLLEKYDCLEGISFIRKILTHPYPVGDSTTGVGPEGIKDGLVYFWRNGFGTGALSEPQGLLGLSARNDSTAMPVTREATIEYINGLIDKEKTILEEKEKKEKKLVEYLAKKAQQQAEKLAFLNLRS